LHDASEAYLGDMNSPLKHYTPAGPAYREIEGEIESRIFTKFRLPYPMPEEVKYADNQMLYAEKAQLMIVTEATKYEADKWNCDESEAPITIERWTPRRAEKMFLKRFVELYKEK
jgi:5'-deoxynucleotidase YfbR-like HD superfamily hydrolase